LVEISNRSVVVAHLVPDKTPMTIDIGVSEREPDRSIEVDEGAIEHAEAPPHLASAAKCGGVVRSEADRRIVVRQRALRLAPGFPGLGAVCVRCGVTRVTFDRLIKRNHRMVDLAMRRLRTRLLVALWLGDRYGLLGAMQLGRRYRRFRRGLDSSGLDLRTSDIVMSGFPDTGSWSGDEPCPDHDDAEYRCRNGAAEVFPVDKIILTSAKRIIGHDDRPLLDRRADVIATMDGAFEPIAARPNHNSART
jgi:hypothetical protein